MKYWRNIAAEEDLSCWFGHFWPKTKIIQLYVSEWTCVGLFLLFKQLSNGLATLHF